MSRRSYGSGSLLVRRDAGGHESWYGKWYAGGRRVQRRLGPRRAPGSREGLTRAQAERELRRLIETEQPIVRSRLGIEEAGERYLEHLETLLDRYLTRGGHVLERKPTTVADYGYMLRRHFVPFFGTRSLEQIDAPNVARYLVAKKREGLATKTITNHLVFMHGLFGFAVRRGGSAANPVDGIDRPRASGSDPDIRYLTLAEVETVLRSVPDGRFAGTDRAMYLIAAMTGLRQGELLGLRWSDVDWRAGRLRVRRTFTRGRWGSPKSRRSSRSVPMTDRVAGALERRFQASAYQADEDLVFCNPQTGRPLDASRMRKRFKKALERAAVRPVRFHDLRHTFGTHCAAAGVPLRTLQEWMGHRDAKTTQVYADYAPSEHEGALVAKAFEHSGSARCSEDRQATHRTSGT